MYKVLGTDINKGEESEFITVIEGHEYPIFGFMFHPEYQSMEFIDNKKAFEQARNEHT